MQKEQFSKLSFIKILVTGGAEFIGSNLCEKLIEFEASVVVWIISSLEKGRIFPK